MQAWALLTASGMRTLRFAVCFGLIAFGCGSNDKGGEKGVLGFRFGLGGCASVSASNATLARGGTTDLVVADSQKHTELTVRSESPLVIDPAADTLQLTCSGDNCSQNQGTLPMAALTAGSSRMVFETGGVLLDAISLNVSDATSIVLGDKDGNVTNVKGREGVALELRATLKAGGAVAYAKSPFTWSVEGSSIPAINSQDSTVSVTPSSSGTSTVTVKFGGLSAQLPVTVDPAN